MKLNSLPRIGLFLLFALSLQACSEESARNNGKASENADATESIGSIGDLALPNSSGPGTTGPNFRTMLFQNDPRISYCEVSAENNKNYSGFRDHKTYPIASLSKVVTSAWVLNQIGADYRFKTEWFLRPVDLSRGIYDAYLRTNYDPIVNTEKILFYLAQLKNRGVISIRELMIDETTRVYPSVLQQPHLELNTVPVSIEDSGKNLFQLMNSENWGPSVATASKNLYAWMATKNISLSIPKVFEVQTVVYRSAHQINRNYYTQSVAVSSAPVLSYLKSVNVFSNNYISDFLFWRLGGTTKFAKFQTEQLRLASSEMSMYTGSGLAEQKLGTRRDNQASCQAMLKVLGYIHKKANEANLNLGHLLLNSSRDTSGTFQTKIPISLRTDNLVLKTGRLFDNPALNLAGVVSTKKGTIYFAFLGHNFKNSDADDIEQARDQMLTDLLKFYPTQNSFVSAPATSIFL